MPCFLVRSATLCAADYACRGDAAKRRGQSVAPAEREGGLSRERRHRCADDMASRAAVPRTQVSRDANWGCLIPVALSCSVRSEEDREIVELFLTLFRNLL